eukprot:927717-Alexandrium_andersonii.AAC.1
MMMNCVVSLMKSGRKRAQRTGESNSCNHLLKPSQGCAVMDMMPRAGKPSGRSLCSAGYLWILGVT